MEEFVNSAWRGQRTSEEREPSLWERGEDHQEGGAQFCSSSTSGLQWEKVRVWKREWMKQSSNLGGRSFCQLAFVSWPLQKNLRVWNAFGVKRVFTFLSFNQLWLQNTNHPGIMRQKIKHQQKQSSALFTINHNFHQNTVKHHSSGRFISLKAC